MAIGEVSEVQRKQLIKEVAKTIAQRATLGKMGDIVTMRKTLMTLEGMAEQIVDLAEGY